MSETDMAVANHETRSLDSQASPSGGTLLRMAREAQGLGAPGLAASLKVSVNKIDALESDRLDLLPDLVFARALACSVCRTLKIDSTPILARFPTSSVPPMKTDESGINAPFRASGDSGQMALLAQLRRPVVVAVLFLLVAAFALLFVSSAELKSVINVFQFERDGVVTTPLTTSTSLTAQSPPLVEPVIIDSRPPSDLDNSPTSSAVPAATSTAADASVRHSASPLPLTVQGSGASTGMVVLKARGSSWIEVVDARGIVQVRKTMIEGETLGASGVAPLSVTIGRADAVDTQVRGKPFDLTGVSKNNVARFEVK